MTKSGSGADGDPIAAFQKAYEDATKDLGKFNLAIFGKTGVGKSTLINAIFGSEVALTGTGVPVTLKTTYYEHPGGFFGVFDSQGIEVGQEGDSILEGMRATIRERRALPIADQIHVIWYCVRAGDLRFEDSQAEFVRQLAAEGIPVLFVLTQTPMRGGRIHPEAEKLAESIIGRDLPITPPGHVFFTMAQEDAFSELSAHGLEELLSATFRVAPEGVRSALAAAQKINLQLKADRARVIVRQSAAAAATAGAVPIPFADAAVLVPIQVNMMARVAAGFGLGVKKGSLATLAGAAFGAGGATQAGKYLATNLIKLLPGGNIAGGAIRASVASSLTYAMGEAWIEVCSRLFRLGPGAVDQLSSQELRNMFLEAFRARAKRAPRATDTEGAK
jgi:uncharacterized protein (DUF697 family)